MKKFLLNVKIVLLFFTTLFTVFEIHAQVTEPCGTMEHHRLKMQTDPAYAKAFLQNETILQQWENSHANLRASNSAVPDTIPVVVHVIWKTSGQNISDAQVFSQIDVLNEDYSRTNADTVNTPAVWQSIAGKMPYYFVLARRDPNGNPTNGIIHKQTTVNSFSTDDAVKFNSQGGSDAWDVNKYLNIWVCNLVSGLYGYAEFPTANPSITFGFVCDYGSFGRLGSAQPPLNLGRTTTHEIGHCFNLFHIWGDDSSACTGSDNIGDTPNQAGPTNFTCYTYPHTDACSPNPPGVMFMNYMDYSVDSCLNMFTQNQTTRMTAAINSFYPTIVNSEGIQPVILQAVDAGIPKIINPGSFNCSTSVTQVVNIKNWGTTDLTSATIYYRIDNDPWQSYAWSGTLTSLSSVDVTLPAGTTTGGVHTFYAYTALPNNSTDLNNSNDTLSVVFTVMIAGQAVPYSEAFTAALFPPSGWQQYNDDGGTGWARANASHGGGTGSMWMDNYNYNARGRLDELETPFFDLTTVTDPQLSFYLAYRLYTDPVSNPNYSDTLEVLISTDCGITYTSLYKKSGTALATTSPVWLANSFVPTSNQWRMEVIDLNAYAADNAVRFKFRNINDYQNNLYVDDINITTTTSIRENTTQKLFGVYPNPTNGMINVSLANTEIKTFEISVVDLPGKTVLSKKVNSPKSGIETIDLSSLPNGIYILKLKSDKGIAGERIVLEK